MPALARGDAERLLRFVGEAESLAGDDPFTGELLVELGRLVSADWVTYNELDRVRERLLFAAVRPGDEDDDVDVDDSVLWNLVYEEHPICVRRREGDFSAVKLSDFLTQRELHRSRVYGLWFRPFGVEYELNVAIPSPMWHTKSFLFDRTDRDFSERDRLVLNLLEPHFARLWRAARTRRLLAAALEGLGHASDDEPRGVLLLTPNGALEFASPPARRLLGKFFPAANERLPIELADWLASGAEQPLIRDRGARRLVIRRASGALLLEEEHEELLTAREREVLCWVARGKTNADVARLLWIAPGTVRKHLENVYAKLGVRTRTAAVTRFLGLVDEAEASSG